MWMNNTGFNGSMEYFGKSICSKFGMAPEKNLDEIVSDMSLEQSAIYLKNHYKINKQEERIISEILNFISDFMSMK